VSDDFGARSGDEGGLRVLPDGGGARRQAQHAREPLGARAVQIPLGLGRIERQVMRHDRVLQAHFAERHLLIGIRHLLQVVVTRDQRIDKPLRRARLQQVQDDLRILRSFLSHELYIASRVRATASDETGHSVKPACPRRCHRLVVVTRWLERDDTRLR
jgi:hypothetical protein